MGMAVPLINTIGMLVMVKCLVMELTTRQYSNLAVLSLPANVFSLEYRNLHFAEHMSHERYENG